MTNSRRKGCVGELEASKALAEHLKCSARRGRQYSGSEDSPDVVASIPGLHWEIKRVEKFDLYGAMQQACDDSGENVPVVMHRRNHRDWVVCVRLEDVVRFVTSIYLHLQSVN